MDRNRLMEVPARLVYETKKAYKLSQDEDDGPDGGVWVPKSKVRKLDKGLYSVPVWLCQKHELQPNNSVRFYGGLTVLL